MSNHTASTDLAQLDKLEAIAEKVREGGMRMTAREMDEIIVLVRRSLASGAPAELADKVARQKVAVALGLESDVGGPASFAWAYLLGIIREYVKAVEEMESSAGAAAKTEQALPPVVCVGRPFPTTDKATIFFARDVTDDELLQVNEVLRSRLNRHSATAAGAGSAQPAALDERALFDAWCIRKGYSTNKWHDGGYVDSNTQNGWEVWKARAALTQQAGAAAPSREDVPVGPALREVTRAVVERLGWTINGTWVVTKSGDHIHTADAIAFVHAALARAPLPTQSNELTDVVRDMLAIQEVCGLHTDEYAPGSVVEYIKELEGDAAHPGQDGEKDAMRYRWLRNQPDDTNAPRIDVVHWLCHGDDSVNQGEGLRLEALDEAIDAAMAAKGTDGQAAAQQDAKGGAA